MDEWHIGDPPDWGDSVGVPDIPYMGYISDDDEEDGIPPHFTHSDTLRDEAWRLRNEDRLDEALARINEALETSGSWKNYNVKAIILEDMFEYERALECYDMALERSSSQLVKDNKARLLVRMVENRTFQSQVGLEKVNLALKLSKDERDSHDFLIVKSNVLESMGRIREAYVSRKLANMQFDLVDAFESQLKTLAKGNVTYICIAARRFYGHSAPCTGGSVVDLVKEPYNGHDPDAIRVEFNGKTVGYVANSSWTLIEEAKSATDIKGMFGDRTKAEIMFIFMEQHLVAKLI